MSDALNAASEAQRFPIGRFQRQAAYSADQRAEHVARIAAQPQQLSAALSGLNATDYATPYRPGW